MKMVNTQLKYSLKTECNKMKTKFQIYYSPPNLNIAGSKKSTIKKSACIFMLAIFTISGCAGDNILIKSKKPPISHVHYGHTLTGWHDTPDKKGLFVTAEEVADEIARQSVELDTQISQQPQFDKDGAVHSIQKISLLLEGESETDYTLLRALTKSSNHMLFAAESDDASLNMINGAQEFEKNVSAVFAREKLLRQIAQSISMESNEQAIKKAARQLRILSVQILEGVDSNSDGVIGSSPSEYGLRQLRNQLALIAENENPAYQPVEKKYLFGLVRLPGGKWAFKDASSGGGNYDKYDSSSY